MNGGPKIIHRKRKGGGITQAGEGDVEAVTYRGQDREKDKFPPQDAGVGPGGVWGREGPCHRREGDIVSSKRRDRNGNGEAWHPEWGVSGPSEV